MLSQSDNKKQHQDVHVFLWESAPHLQECSSISSHLSWGQHNIRRLPGLRPRRKLILISHSYPLKPKRTSTEKIWRRLNIFERRATKKEAWETFASKVNDCIASIKTNSSNFLSSLFFIKVKGCPRARARARELYIIQQTRPLITPFKYVRFDDAPKKCISIPSCLQQLPIPLLQRFCFQLRRQHEGQGERVVNIGTAKSAKLQSCINPEITELSLDVENRKDNADTNFRGRI